LREDPGTGDPLTSGAGRNWPSCCGRLAPVTWSSFLDSTGWARSTRDLLNVLDVVAKAGAGFRSLKDTWADTTTPHGRLLVTMLAGIAEFERELIRARTGEGRKLAKAPGVKFGRPSKLTPHQRQEALQRLAAGETEADIARTYNVNATTIGRLEPRPFDNASASVAA
jgi:DNA invertase Pin-like site-specific DNA recombinase